MTYFQNNAPENFADKIYHFVGAVCDAIPYVFFMGKVHGVDHKAKKSGNWSPRNPNKIKEHNDKNGKK